MEGITFALRLLLAWAVPIWAFTQHDQPTAIVMFVVSLSFVATLIEVWGFIKELGVPPRVTKARASRKLWSFALQLLPLYLLQVWLVTFATGMYLASSQDVATSAHVERELPVDNPHPVQPAPVLRGDLHKAVDAQAATNGPQALTATVDSQKFELDAPPEALRWNPKTISVVLPCAEERDYALRTVESVFQMTPAETLHEIVVVDDGSNPPLSETHLKPDVQKKYKVTLRRHENTVGLIGAKKTGGDAATGDLVIFFDCHVAPQKDWYKDFLGLISQNYRRMVIPQITALDIDTWSQVGGGGGMSKCYVTWDGDFKWGGTDDMYMGMLSGGLLGMSRRWWIETGGYDVHMLGWGGENIDQGIRCWVCGGEIVAAPNSQVAHMWRTGEARTSARYRHVGDTIMNRARAIYAWSGEFARKLDDFPSFAYRKNSGGENWYGDMSNFQEVKNRLQGCRPFAWYLRRFKTIYEDAGLLPPEIFMLKDEKSGQCLFFMGSAGTSGAGREGVRLASCDESNHRYFWHMGNRKLSDGSCCSGLRAWNTEQCFQGMQGGGQAQTGICEVSGSNSAQHWRLRDGQLQDDRGNCIGATGRQSLESAPCLAFRSRGGARWTKEAVRVPFETELYRREQREHPQVFAKLNEEIKAQDAMRGVPAPCRSAASGCWVLATEQDGNRCLDDTGNIGPADDGCAAIQLVESDMRDGVIVAKLAINGACLDTWSDADPLTWGFYGCHGGSTQRFNRKGEQLCNLESCFSISPWKPGRPR